MIKEVRKMTIQKITGTEALKAYNQKVKQGFIERTKPKNPKEKYDELSIEQKKRALRASINAKCWDCCCEQRNEIKNCTIKKCSLWYVRPYK